ncbi:MAG TPA: BTAD domain-containing putative transcriptional regulator, partial [Nakamurella sp.]
DAELALGHHNELIGQLRSLVEEFPLRERLRGCLMTALYRSGRQAEALDAYQDTRRALTDELGIEPSEQLRDLERSILRHDHVLDPPDPTSSTLRTERAILVAVADEGRLPALLAVAEPLVRRPPRSLILATTVIDATSLPVVSTRLDAQRELIQARGVAARATAFTSTTPGADLARLSTELDVDLLLTDAPEELLIDGRPDDRLTALLDGTTCDVALLVPRPGAPRGPVLVPFGGSDHDWSAVELGAWLARAQDVALRLAGADAVPELGRRDASRLLSHASLAVQRVLGVPAAPVLVEAGPDGMLRAGRDAGMLVVGMSARWRTEGLGPARLRLAREAAAPLLLVRRGLRPGGLAPQAALTSFTWSIRA